MLKASIKMRLGNILSQPETAYTCNLCGSSAFRPMYVLHGRSLVACAECGLRSFFPLPSEAEFDALYQDPAYHEREYFGVDDRALGTNHFLKMTAAADTALAKAGPGGKLLDIGPGKGLFLELCLDRGLAPEGLEINAVEAGSLQKRLGCPVQAATLETASYPVASFDAVASFDVMEHCLDPADWLRRIHRLLKPGGLFMCSTVSFRTVLDGIGRLAYILGMKGPAARLYPSYHLYYFTPELFRTYLGGAGFVIERLEQVDYDPRKATRSLLERLTLRTIYATHALTGRRTNMYATAMKPAG